MVLAIRASYIGIYEYAAEEIAVCIYGLVRCVLSIRVLENQSEG